jgi:hypothetical protein
VRTQSKTNGRTRGAQKVSERGRGGWTLGYSGELEKIRLNNKDRKKIK